MWYAYKLDFPNYFLQGKPNSCCCCFFLLFFNFNMHTYDTHLNFVFIFQDWHGLRGHSRINRSIPSSWQKKENLPYGWLTHWKWATMVAKIRPVRVTRGGWCCTRLTRRIFKACAITWFRNQFVSVGSHLKSERLPCSICMWFQRLN